MPCRSRESSRRRSGGSPRGAEIAIDGTRVPGAATRQGERRDRRDHAAFGRSRIFRPRRRVLPTTLDRRRPSLLALLLRLRLWLLLHHLDVALRARMTLRRRLVEPLLGLLRILLHALAVGVEDAEVVLRLGETSIGRLAEQRRGLFQILGHSLPHRIQQPQVVLRRRDPAVRRFLQPFRGLSDILWNAAAREVQQGQVVLRRRETLFGREPSQSSGLGVVLGQASQASQVDRSETRLRDRIAGVGMVAAIPHTRRAARAARNKPWIIGISFVLASGGGHLIRTRRYRPVVAPPVATAR